ncbi:dihydroxyacetone kinase phosphoryl donor subunit DhaM [Pectinatus sottacetonis]|uniref:dihydroxyacetone kinase phosphoryl donor subunit DhaM n=1 Tax=Pectinatus sottacetonis TaxID=1002795 RepID=UPI0018C51724|nr:dihydroxyacetone kinase phosphoryl donor subunit DhaM [Pectinatus sottacetonis]
MVGIIIVSHSLKAAEGIKEIAVEMAKPDQPISAVGGTTDGKLGIDLDRVEDAIEKMDEKDGMILFVDLGSAIICGDMIRNNKKINKKNVYIANAPILEGTVIATIEASLGSSVEKVLEVAEEAGKLPKFNF